jgi:hypothetical protein
LILAICDLGDGHFRSGLTAAAEVQAAARAGRALLLGHAVPNALDLD